MHEPARLIGIVALGDVLPDERKVVPGVIIKGDAGKRARRIFRLRFEECNAVIAIQRDSAVFLDFFQVAHGVEGQHRRVLLATDADVDGMHIRNLMITYFFRFFEQLVHDGHVYVLETPLFRVRNKEKTIYCYSETERDNAVKELGGNPACVAGAIAEKETTEASESKAKSGVQHTSARRRPEITRFRDLCEISPKEFAQFIGKEMRLSKVEYAPKVESGPIFNFYMGKNTPERKDHIMDKLVMPVEE